MRISTKYDIGDTVFIKTDKEQLNRMVTCITLNPGNIVYSLTNGTTQSAHYEFELSREKNVLLQVSE